MKKLTLMMAAAIVGLSASGATVYWDNTETGWDKVCAYSWSPDVAEELTSTTVDGHTLYAITLDNEQVIFRSTLTKWAEEMQTSNLPVVDGAVYGKGSIKSNGGSDVAIANIVNGKYVAADAPAPSEYPELFARGTMNGWGSSSSWKLDTEDGVTYTLSKTIEKDAKFKIASSTWEKNGGMVWAGETALTVKAGSYTLVNSSASVDMTAGEDITSISLNVSTGVMVINGGNGGNVDPTPDPTPSDAVTISGDYNLAYCGDKENVHYWGGSESKWPGVKMETAKGSDGKTYKVAKLPEGTTGLIFNTNGNENKTDDLKYTSEFVMDDNGATSTAVKFEEGGNVDPTPDPTPDSKTLYLVGDQAGWSVNEDYKFAQNGNVYTLTLNDGLTGKWKIWDGTWAYNFGKGADEPEAGVEYDTWFDGADFTASFTGKVTIKFTLVAGSEVKEDGIPSKLLITADGSVEPTPVEPSETDEWYVNVVGPWNDWKDNGVHPVNGVAELEGLKIGAGEFKIKVYDGAKDNWYCNGEAIVLDQPTVITSDTAQGVHMTIADASEGDVFNVKWDCNNFTLLITKVNINDPSGIEALDAEEGSVVYFNLQGVRVANPENGIFVRVANGKAAKVVK